MTYQDPRDRNGNPNRSDASSERGSTAAFVLTAVAAIALVAVLSPRLREVRNEPVVYAQAIAPGPIPSTERRPDAWH